MKLIKFLVILAAAMMSYRFSNINILGWVLLFLMVNYLIKDMRNGWEKEKLEHEEAIEKELEEIEMKCERERESLRRWENR